MPTFTNAQNFVIKNSHFTDQHITVNSSAGPTGIDILLETSIPAATYDSSARDPPPRCFPGTREQYVEDIVHWALPAASDSPLPIYWLKGPAGVGKSAIAQTCVEKLKRLDKLGAAFFFSTNRHNKLQDNPADDRKEHQKFFTSIAYQLTTIYPNYHNLLDNKIRRDKTLVDKSLESQFRALIIEPLQELEAKGQGIGKRIPVFVDGLDECEDRDAQCQIVEIVTAATHDGVAPLCWAFFSRPEPHIEATFSMPNVSSLCHTTIVPISSDADGDVELYLRAGFVNILRRLNIVMRTPWPSDSDMKELVRAAGGLFIYATTLLRFVGQSDSLGPEALLRAVLAVISNRSQRSPTPDLPFAELDDFYVLILQRIPNKILPSILLVLASMCRNGPLSTIMTANILGLSRAEIEALCNQMSAVVRFQPQAKPLELGPTVDASRSFQSAVSETIPADVYNTIRDSLGGSVSFYHKSFKDFLVDEARSGSYCVTIPRRRNILLKQELKFRLDYERSHSWHGSELVLAPGVPDSASCLSYPGGNELINSLLQTLIYRSITRQDMESLDNLDFRIHLYISAALVRCVSTGQQLALQYPLRGCSGFYKYVRGTMLARLAPGEFPKFDVKKLKEFIKDRRRASVLRPHYPNFISRFKSPLFGIFNARVESGLYLVGRGSKSVFWYWEVNYDLATYQEFMTFDLAEGERLYQEERFDLWTKSRRGN